MFRGLLARHHPLTNRTRGNRAACQSKSSALLWNEGARVKLGRATPGDVLPAVQRAIATSGVTVSRAGAYAPTRKELETVL